MTSQFFKAPPYKTDEQGNLRIITFQSKEVVDTILEKGMYTPDYSKIREHNEPAKYMFEEDNDCYVWAYVVQEDWTNHAWYSGALISAFKEEMSISDEDFSKLYLLDLIVVEHLAEQGYTGFHKPGVVLTPYIQDDAVKGIYKMEKVMTDVKHSTIKLEQTQFNLIASPAREGYAPLFEDGFRILSYVEISDYDIDVKATAQFPLKSPQSLAGTQTSLTVHHTPQSTSGISTDPLK